MKRVRDEYTMESLLRAQARRQAIIDYLLAHPLSSLESVLYGLEQHHPVIENIGKQTVLSAIAAMVRSQEVASTGDPRRYIAIVNTTQSAEISREKHLAKNKRHKEKQRVDAARQRKKDAEDAANDAAVPSKNTWNGGSIVHIGGSLPQGSAQRGQGAVRQPVTVNCFITW